MSNDLLSSTILETLKFRERIKEYTKIYVNSKLYQDLLDFGIPCTRLVEMSVLSEGEYVQWRQDLQRFIPM